MVILSNAFNDSHLIHFPYETRRTGIRATGAAIKVIRAVENAEPRRVAHPLSGGPPLPRLQPERPRPVQAPRGARSSLVG